MLRVEEVERPVPGDARALPFSADLARSSSSAPSAARALPVIPRRAWVASSQDQVNVLPPRPRRQQPQLSHAPLHRETITGLQLGVDVPDVRVDITGIR